MGSTIDLSEFEGGPRGGSRCTVHAAVEQMTEDQRNKLTAALAREDIQGTQIARVLASWGFPIKAPSIQRHRRQECTCGR